MSSIKLALFNIKKNFKNEKELKITFIINIIGMALNNIIFLFIWYYFGKTVGVINGWDPKDIFGLYAYSGIVLGFTNAFFNGILNIPNLIISSNFDKYLLTPKNILLKVSTSSLSVSSLGDLLFGIICYFIFLSNNTFNISQILLSFYLMIISIIVYYSFTLFCMTISFYLMDGSNISNGLYGTFVSNTLYHGGAFIGVLRLIFIFLIPSLVVGALPVETIKNPSLEGVISITFISIMWFYISVKFFYKSLRKYESNNLFGFGS